MLKLEKLNNQSFDDIVENAVKGIARFDTEWNNLQASDPGMTLVDLFAWLKALQHEYMSVILPESQRRFLALLDIHQRRGRGSRTLIELSGAQADMEIPAQTKWMAGDLVFENPEPATVYAAALTAVSFRSGDQEAYIEHARLDGARIFDVFPGLGPEPKGKADADMTLWFDRAIPAEGVFSLYFSVHTGGVKRASVGEDGMFPMAALAWEVLTAEGWAEAELLRDDTCGFLFSGVVRLCCHSDMAVGAHGFALRVRLVEDDYDLPPRISGICTNVLELRQQDTLVRCDEFQAGEAVTLRSDLGVHGLHRVFLEDGDGWRETEDFRCEGGPDRLTVVLPEDGAGKVLVLSYDEHIAGRLVLGSGTGFSNQQLAFEVKHVLYDSVRLMVGRRSEDGYRFHEWEKRDDLYSSGPYSRHFVLELEQECIRFGDHERGVMPPKGVGNILLTGLQTCRGRASNIKANMITGVRTYQAAVAALRVRQIVPATGGEDAETFAETSARAGATLKSGEKAVTQADYLAAVRSAPGIAVENCRVLTGFSGPGDARITVVVQGAGRARRRPTAAYERNIRKALDRRRLLNTQIQVVWPEPVKLVIRGRIMTALYYSNPEELVRARIRDFVEELNRSFGAPLIYGEFYSAVDMLDCVSSIAALSVEPVGASFTKTRTDDIIVPPNSIYELERFELTFMGAL